MEQQPEALMLARLGLTPAQARIFAALYQSGLSTAKAISKNSKVARSDVYRVMAALEKLGLVEKNVSAPCKFKAIPIQDAISILMERRREVTSELQATAREILKKFKKSGIEKPLKKDETQFVLVPQNITGVNRIRNAIEKSQESMDVLLSWKRFSDGINNVFTENFERARARNVRVRFIVESPPRGKAEENLIKSVRKSPMCQIRFVPKYPDTILGIYDKKEISLVVNPTTNLPDSPELWSNSQSLITIAQDYFDILWITSMENPNHEAAREQVENGSKPSGLPQLA
jgi:sugar-specific transcriptional regulator TrmB